MKLSLTNHYEAPGQNPIEVYENACIRDANCALTSYRELGNTATLLKDSVEGDILEREILIQPKPEAVPGALRTLAGDDAFDCIQTTRYNFSTHTGSATTQMTGSFLKDRFSSNASYSVFYPDPSNKASVNFQSDSEVKVSIFMIGGKNISDTMCVNMS